MECSCLWADPGKRTWSGGVRKVLRAKESILDNSRVQSLGLIVYKAGSLWSALIRDILLFMTFIENFKYKFIAYVPSF